MTGETKNLDFFEALRKVVFSGAKLRFKKKDWDRYLRIGGTSAMLINAKGVCWWPTPEQQIVSNWEVEDAI